MTLQDTADMMSIIRAAYPRFYANVSDADAGAALNLWHSMFEGDDAELVRDALTAFIASDTKGFPPVPGQIREKLGIIQEATYGFEMTEQAAWSMVTRALRDSAYHSAERFAELPEDIQRCVGSASQLHDWAVSDDDALQSVVASNFMRSYRAIAAKRREIRSMPAGVRERIESAKDTFGRLESAQKAAPEIASATVGALEDKLRRLDAPARKAFFDSLVVDLDAEENGA